MIVMHQVTNALLTDWISLCINYFHWHLIILVKKKQANQTIFYRLNILYLLNRSFLSWNMKIPLIFSVELETNRLTVSVCVIKINSNITDINCSHTCAASIIDKCRRDKMPIRWKVKLICNWFRVWVVRSWFACRGKAEEKKITVKKNWFNDIANAAGRKKFRCKHTKIENRFTLRDRSKTKKRFHKTKSAFLIPKLRKRTKAQNNKLIKYSWKLIICRH